MITTVRFASVGMPTAGDLMYGYMLILRLQTDQSKPQDMYGSIVYSMYTITTRLRLRRQPYVWKHSIDHAYGHNDGYNCDSDADLMYGHIIRP